MTTILLIIRTPPRDPVTLIFDLYGAGLVGKIISIKSLYSDRQREKNQFCVFSTAVRADQAGAVSSGWRTYFRRKTHANRKTFTRLEDVFRCQPFGSQTCKIQIKCNSLFAQNTRGPLERVKNA